MNPEEKNAAHLETKEIEGAEIVWEKDLNHTVKSNGITIDYLGWSAFGNFLVYINGARC